MIVFKVNNGEVFFKHNHLNVSKEKARKLCDDGNYEYATCKEEGGIKSYYDMEGNFIGNAGIHIQDEYSEFQEYIYLVKKEESELEKKVDLKRLFK